MPDVGERDKQALALCTVTIALAQPPGFCSSRRRAFFPTLLNALFTKKQTNWIL